MITKPRIRSIDWLPGANLAERMVSRLRKQKSELIEKDAPREQVKVIDERITKLMAGFNRQAKELHRGSE